MLQQAVVAGERVFELMDGPRQQYGNDDRPLQSGTIDVDNVSFAYRDDNLVLKNINLSVPSRNFVALVGHTGSGKSTLASLLMGYYPLTEGEIRLDGRPLSTLSHSALRQGVAMVQQDPVVLADTFLANVTLGRDISEERVWQALETVQLAELARSMSDGIYTPLGEQGNNLSVGQKQLLALARVLVETPQILILDEATASIDSGVDNVSFAYRDDNLVLKNINLSVPSRNFVALVGHTGSGKSTLASLLMGYYPLTEGEIRLDGRPLSTLSHSALRQGVAMVQQDPVVLADTFLANVTLGRDISEERVWQALETVQLAELARSMSDGIYTPLGEQGNNLSVGQKQLLALARVLVETPQILILDEATASIDSGTEQAIQHALAAVREHTTLVVIAHRLSTIVDADTILVLHRGQAVEQGTHQQLLAAQGRYWQMYQLQLAGEELAASLYRRFNILCCRFDNILRFW